jgi:hypothetical protein
MHIQSAREKEEKNGKREFSTFLLTINHSYYSETPTNKKKVAAKTQKNTKPKKKRNSTKNKEGVEDDGKIKESNESSDENESKKKTRTKLQ